VSRTAPSKRMLPSGRTSSAWAALMSVAGLPSSWIRSVTSASSSSRPAPASYVIPVDVPETSLRLNCTGASVFASCLSPRYTRLSVCSSKPSSVVTMTCPWKLPFCCDGLMRASSETMRPFPGWPLAM